MIFKSHLLQFINRLEEDEIFTLAGSLAFTTGLAMAPFVIIMLSLALVTGESFDKSMISQISNLLGEQAAQAVQMVLESARKAPISFGVSNILQIVVLAVSASTIFAQLRNAFDKIDRYKRPKREPGGFWRFIKERLFCIQLVFAFAFMSVTSLLVTATLTAVLPPGDQLIGKTLVWIVNIAVFLILFTSIFRFIPSSRYSWRRCFLSGGIATVFFLLGKLGISLYLGRVAVGSAYGAAGSLVVFLVWVYYTTLTLLLSYEFTIEMIARPQSE